MTIAFALTQVRHDGEKEVFDHYVSEATWKIDDRLDLEYGYDTAIIRVFINNVQVSIMSAEEWMKCGRFIWNRVKREPAVNISRNEDPFFFPTQYTGNPRLSQ